MKIKVKYSANSNINYTGTWAFDVDPDEWAELDEQARTQALGEMVADKLAEDIGWDVAE